MAEFLSQDEIDELLCIAEEHIPFPIFIYLKKPTGGYGILEVTEDVAKQLLGREKFYEDDIYKTLERRGNKIIICEESKHKLTKEIHKRYNALKDAEHELKVLKKHLSEFPEYIV